MWRRVSNYVTDTLTSARPRSCVRVTATTGANDALDFREMPTPRSFPVVGTTLALLRAGSAPRLHEYVHGRHAELGPIYRESMGPVDAVFVCDPEEMRTVFSREGKYPKHVLPDAWVLYNQMYKCTRGLFFMDGEEWFHFRRVMNKMLLKTDALSWLRDPCNEVASTIVTRWESLLCAGNTAIIPNLEAEMYRISIDTLIAVLLGDKYAECKSTLEHDVAYLASVVHLIFQTSAKLYLIPATWAATFKLPAWTRFVRAADDGLNVANTLTKKIMYDCPRGNGLVAKMMNENMNETDIARIVTDLILAAGDTTAYSMQWTLYLLAKNMQVQDKLLASVDDEMNHTNLIKGIMREALRLYPVAPFLTRILPQDTSIGGYMVPNGTLIIMSLYTSGRNTKYFELPEMFWPERWFRNGCRDYVAASSYASIPFAMGARSCIGRKIAETQMQAALKKITNRFRLELMNENNVELILRMVSVPSTPLSIKITARN